MSKLADLNRTYTWQGREMTFWSLAPAFRVSWAVSKIKEHPRSFVWLWDTAEKKFVHAVVAVGVGTVLRVRA